MSRDQFLRDPARHSSTIGAFHVFQELHVVGQALRQERRRRCAEVVEIFPLKWIHSGSSGGAAVAGDRTVTLGQVQSFTAPGIFQDSELRASVDAALTFLLPLIAWLAAYLDVTLPFPCSGGPWEGVQPLWPWPSVLHAFSGRWRCFSAHDGCTPDFAGALRLVDEDLRQLCACQGEPAPKRMGSLQLLAHLLSSANLGCLWPSSPDQGTSAGPSAQPEPLGAGPANQDSSASSAATQRSGGAATHTGGVAGTVLAGSCDAEDGEWTILES